ncbi:MAG: phosphoribosylglycinamide formyltransferase [Myxococcota bacterium]
MSEVPVALLASGSGSNVQALINAAALPGHPARIVLVASDRRDALALERARRCGIPAVHVPRRGHPDRASYDAAMVEVLRQHGAEWVFLAGYMRLVSPTFLAAFPQRVLNVHPALLPCFPGLDAQQQALDAGVRVSGCTIHLVDEGTDTGPIVAQGAVPVLPDDDLEALRRRILRMEHELFPRVLRWAVEGRIRVEGRRVQLDLPPDETAFRYDPRA